VIPSTTNRRGVLSAVIAAGSALALATPTIASSPALSPLDERILDLWRQRNKLKQAMENDLDDLSDEVGEKYCAVFRKLDDEIDNSVLALAGVLIEAIHDDDVEPIPGLNRAALAAIRPRLVGEIAADADRALAEATEVYGEGRHA
jgi:hypothetical protein